jgi:phosphatidylethanolamine/phosphatidyl-N-methylethanolamine N-methyltransferase
MDTPRPCSGQMIEAAGTTEQIRRAYDLWSYIYARIAGPLERGPRLRALELATTQPVDRVLEVGVGTGAIFLEILKQGNARNRVCGIDLSAAMLQRTKHLISENGYRDAGLYQADARHLPFPDAVFDLIYSSYVLDLLN